MVFLEISQNSHKTSVLESLFNEVAGLKTCNFIKKRLHQNCFSVKFAKFLRTSFLQNTSEWLFLIGFGIIAVVGKFKVLLIRYENIYVVKEAVTQRFSVKNLFLKISHNSQENTCARVSFLIKLQA